MDNLSEPNDLANVVAERAYALWEMDERPHGRDLDHWLQAERELAPGPAAKAPAGRRRSSRKP